MPVEAAAEVDFTASVEALETAAVLDEDVLSSAALELEAAAVLEDDAALDVAVVEDPQPASIPVAIAAVSSTLTTCFFIFNSSCVCKSVPLQSGNHKSFLNSMREF